MDARGRGNGKTASYKIAGYSTEKNAGQNSYILERNNPRLAELIRVLEEARKAKEVLQSESAEARRINALAEQNTAKAVLEKIEGDESGELARQIQFSGTSPKGR